MEQPFDLYVSDKMVHGVLYDAGDIPYDGITSGGLKARLDSGYRMERPEHCPELMYVASI